MKMANELRKDFEDYIIDTRVKEAFIYLCILLDKSEKFKVEFHYYGHNGKKRRLKISFLDKTLLKEIAPYIAPFEFVVRQKFIKFYIGLDRYREKYIDAEFINKFGDKVNKNKKLKIDIKTKSDVSFIYNNLFVEKFGFDKLCSKELKYSIHKNIEQNLEAVEIEKVSTEGIQKSKHIKYYVRIPRLRTLAIEIHGTICIACGFDFSKHYGKRGDGFIEIHHTVPLSELEEGMQINPEVDLVPLCSNCHRMIHRFQDDILTILELKEILKNNK